MQIKRLHKNMYRLYRYARIQECLEKYRQIYQASVDQWEESKANGATDTLATQYAHISLANAIRLRNLCLYFKDILPLWDKVP